MLKHDFFNLIKEPSLLKEAQLNDLELIIEQYPFFESAHLIYTKGLMQYNALKFPAQLRKCALVVSSRAGLHSFLYKPNKISYTISSPEIVMIDPIKEDIPVENEALTVQSIIPVNPVTITNNELKVIYINQVTEKKEVRPSELSKTLNTVVVTETQILQSIENETDENENSFDEAGANKRIEDEINRSVVQSYVQKDIIKTPQLFDENNQVPASFTDWLKIMQKEAHTFQSGINTKISLRTEKIDGNVDHRKEADPKKNLIDKIIQSDPGRIKLGSNKFFTPAVDAKQSLLENEHLVTETLAKIYALQGNVSKAIRAYEILSLKFPQKSVYFASLIQKLKLK